MTPIISHADKVAVYRDFLDGPDSTLVIIGDGATGKSAALAAIANIDWPRVDLHICYEKGQHRKRNATKHIYHFLPYQRAEAVGRVVEFVADPLYPSYHT